jgi:hypothetical protein
MLLYALLYPAQVPCPNIGTTLVGVGRHFLRGTFLSGIQKVYKNY